MKKGPRDPGFYCLGIRPWGLISTAGAVAGFVSLLGFLGPFHWFADLCSHFRVQYVLLLGAAAFLLLIPRQRRLAALFGALALLNLGVIVPLYFGKASPPASAEGTLRAMLINVNTEHGNPAKVAVAVRYYNPDILVLAEVSAGWLSDLGPVLARYPYSVQEPREDNFGIALFSRVPFTRSGVVMLGEAGVPSAQAEMETPHGTCTVLATHPLPPVGPAYSALRNDQLAKAGLWVQSANSPVLLLGDLNVTPWNHYFKRLVAKSGLKDSAQGRGIHPTWPTFSPLTRIPLDHCLYSPGIGIVKREVGFGAGSDHFPLIIDFVIEGSVAKRAAVTTLSPHVQHKSRDGRPAPAE